MKLNTLLAKTDALSSGFMALLSDYGRFFTKSQGAFLGEKRTYQPKEGTIDEPSKRGNILVQTTVPEKLNWFRETTKDYIDSLFAQEKTNASGVATAELVVDGKSWGEYTSLELLRLKSLVENNELHRMMSSIPVRSDSEEWSLSTNSAYQGRDIYEGPKEEGTNITTVKEDYILKDPNVSDKSPNYNAKVAQKTTIVTLGDYTRQKFSGQWSQRQKAEAIRRKTALRVAIIAALKVCNEAEVIESELTSDKIFGYIFG